MNMKITPSAIIALALIMTIPASGQGLPIVATGSESEANTWQTDGTGGWYNDDGSGVYGSNECSWIETTVPLSGMLLADDPVLAFDYEHDFTVSDLSGMHLDGGVVLISVDAGVSWVPIETGLEISQRPTPWVRDCLFASGASELPDSMIGGTGSGSAHIDLSTVVAPTDLLQVRILLASFDCRDTCRSGWDISDMTVGGLALD